MIEYTKEDIIIFSDDERLKDAIGKECYFSDYPNYIITDINEDKCSLSKLEEIETGYKYPFFNTEGRSYECIIIKKEEPKEYIPFESIEEFIEASLEHNRSHSLSKVHGIWLKNKEDGTTSLIISINENTNYLYFNLRAESLEDIFCNYCFLDDTPCGKLQEVNNE